VLAATLHNAWNSRKEGRFSQLQGSCQHVKALRRGASITSCKLPDGGYPYAGVVEEMQDN